MGGGHVVDPAKLIGRIPEGMEIAGLRQKLIKIIADYTLQLELRSGCNKVLKADSVELSRKLYKAQRRAVRVDKHAVCPLSGEAVAKNKQKGRKRQEAKKNIVIF